MKRYVIIIGAMKSGSTTLFDLLATHPSIAPVRGKEPGFFGFDKIRARGFGWYDGLFDFDPARHVHRLEASTDYTKFPHVPGVWDRMQAVPDIDIRLLYIMRHPLRRIESHARHVQANGKEIGQRPSLHPDHSLDAGISPVNLAVSRYAAQLDAYGQAWDQGRLHLLTLEELGQDPDKTLGAIWEFLGLEAPDDADIPASNVFDTKVRLHPAWRVLSRMRPLMALGRVLLPTSLRRGIRGMFLRPVRSDGRFRLTDAEEAALIENYRADLRRLRDHYGVDTERLWGIAP